MANKRFWRGDMAAAGPTAPGVVITALAALCAVSAHAGVELRIDSRPASEPVEAYALVTDGSTPIVGLTAEDFAVTLDGAALTDFEWAPPPSRDPAQKVSILIVTHVFDPAASAFVSLVESLDPGDFVAVVMSRPCPEMARMFALATHGFTEIDQGAGSASLIEFIESGGRGSVGTGCTMNRSEVYFRGLELFAAPLPAGPRAMLALGSVGSDDLSALVDIANASQVAVITTAREDPSADPAAAASRIAIAHNTGGVPVEAAQAPGVAVDAIIAWLKHGYRLTIPRTAVDDCNEHLLEVTVGDFSTGAAFGRCDATPEVIGFDYRYPVSPGSTVVSEPRAIASIESPVAVTVYGGQYSIGCGSTFTSQAGVILPEETICLRHTASLEDDTTTLTLLITGGVSSYLASLTPPPSTSPPPPPPPDPSGSTGGGGSSAAVELLLLLGLWLARLTLQHVLARRVADRSVALGGRAHGGRRDALGRGVCLEPLGPGRPPGSGPRLGGREPFVGG